MRGRPKEPGGKRIQVSVKVSEQMAAAIDVARGSTDRPAWVRSAIAAALGPDIRNTGIPEPLGLPPEIEAVIEEGRLHPERSRPRPRRSPQPVRAPAAGQSRPPHSVTCKCGTCKPPRQAAR